MKLNVGSELIPDPCESRVEHFLSAHAEHESMRSLRDSAVWWVALSSVGVGIIAEWPGCATNDVRDGIVAIWAMTLAVLGVLTLFEFRLRSRLARVLRSIERPRREEV